MRFQLWLNMAISSFLLSSNVVLADQVSQEKLKMPLCLAQHLSAEYPVIAENNEFKIINVPSTDLDKINLLADEVHCGRFVNVTDKLQQSSAKQILNLVVKNQNSNERPYKIRHKKKVTAALEEVDQVQIMLNLKSLTEFENRSASLQTGYDAALWVQSTFEKMAALYRRTDTETYLVKTGNRFMQPSVVTVIGKNLPGKAVVIGAHIDTLNGRMPGADDDGSGAASTLEVARVLLFSAKLKHPVYIIWYAAEERGLVGSQYVVQDFINKEIPVKAVMQLDMTGYRHDVNDPTMWVYRDYTDNALSDFVASLITTYVNVPVDKSNCGYGCSDHYSWQSEGFPAAFPCETAFNNHNPYIHTRSDTIDRLSPEHMANFAKLGVAFAIELAS